MTEMGHQQTYARRTNQAASRKAQPRESSARLAELGNQRSSKTSQAGPAGDLDPTASATTALSQASSGEAYVADVPASLGQPGQSHTLFPFGIGFGSVEMLQISEV